MMLDDTSSAVTSSRDMIETPSSDVGDDVMRDVSGSAGGELEVAVPVRPRSVCRVCSDDAAGMYFGALVCVPCKVTS